MSLLRITSVLVIVTAFAGTSCAVTLKIVMEKCGVKGFTCVASEAVPSKLDITFNCITNTTTQDVHFLLWSFNAPTTIESLTIQNCEKVRLGMSCSGENKPIQTLTIRNVSYLEIETPTITHVPPHVVFENITLIESIGRNTFSQIKREFYKAGCFVPANDLNKITFKNVNIRTIESGAFRDLKDMTNFRWHNVSVAKTSLNAVDLKFVDGGGVQIEYSNFAEVQPMAFRITGNELFIAHSRFHDIWGTAFNGSVYDFVFDDNKVKNIRSGGFAVLAQRVHITSNNFFHIESGAFSKIAPGLTHDSMRNFITLQFRYQFNNNLIQIVDDGAVRPDIVAYQNVYGVITYANNTQPCSCEGLSWAAADLNLGKDYSVLKEFNDIILDPVNRNVCKFTPCLCFDARTPSITINRDALADFY